MAIINEILQIAARAPSGTNTQPWEIAVVSGKVKTELDAKLLACFDAGAEKHMDYQYYPLEFNGAFKRRRAECGLAMFGPLLNE